METEDLFTMAVQALEQGEWRIGHEFICRCTTRVSTSCLIDYPEMAIELAWCNCRAGYATCREFQRLLEGRNEDNWIDGASWPEQLSNALFDEGLSALRVALQAGRWEVVTSLSEMLIRLPSATDQRQQLLTAALAEVVAIIASEQSSTLAAIEALRGGPRHGPVVTSAEHALLKTARGTWVPFGVPAELLAAAALGDAYPMLAEQLLFEVLREAGWPVLSFFDHTFEISLWPAIASLRDDLQKVRQLGEAGRDWLLRAAAESPEEHAAGDFLEDNQS